MIAVIDYGMGNLRSVQKALELVGAKAKVTSNPKDISKCEKLVFPGVGAFGDAMKELKKRSLVGPIKGAIAEGKPFLGLCLGLQLLFENSEEAPGVNGLSVLDGRVKRFRFAKGGLKVPHMGWNVVNRVSGKRPAGRNERAGILKGVDGGEYFYFVHSYYVKPEDKSVILCKTGYGIDFVSGVKRDNLYGLQFHPEKSQSVGLKVLRNFVNL